MSQHGEPVNEIQMALEVAALSALTDKLRKGSIPGVRARYKSVIHVGHSYGSILSYSLASVSPSASDGLVLTGFSLESKLLDLFFYSANFVPAPPVLPTYSNGYLAVGDAGALQVNIFAPATFDSNIIDFIAIDAQAVSAGELLTMRSFTSVSDFAGPVLVITGGT
jgi:hypothetical protein